MGVGTGRQESRLHTKLRLSCFIAQHLTESINRETFELKASDGDRLAPRTAPSNLTSKNCFDFILIHSKLLS